jgi:CBS domain-containing protein
METDSPTIPAGMPLPEVVPRLLAEPRPELPVVDADGRLLGTVSLADVRAVLPDVEDLGPLARAADAVHGSVPFVRPDDNLDLVMHLLGRTHREEVPVCADAAGRQLVGIVTRDAVIDAYNRRVFQLDLAGGFHSLVDSVRGGRMVEVLGGIVLGEIEVPTGLVGRTLAELDLRRRWNVEVVLVHSPGSDGDDLDGRPGKLPDSGTRLDPGDRLLVMGTAAAIAGLQEGIEARRRREQRSDGEPD